MLKQTKDSPNDTKLKEVLEELKISGNTDVGQQVLDKILNIMESKTSPRTPVNRTVESINKEKKELGDLVETLVGIEAIKVRFISKGDFDKTYTISPTSQDRGNGKLLYEKLTLKEIEESGFKLKHPINFYFINYEEYPITSMYDFKAFFEVESTP